MVTHARRYATLAFSALLITGLASALGACASTDKAGGSEPAKVEVSPTPFTAKQVRDALPTGSKISLRREDANNKVTIEEWEVTAATPKTCTMTVKVFNEDGSQLIDDKGSVTNTWNELRDNAKFPEDQTVRSEGIITVPVGEHETWLYVVTSKTDDGKEMQSYYTFAKDLPGPPVQMSVLVDGKIVSKMTMVGRK